MVSALISIGHYTDSVAKTGLTVFLPEKPFSCQYLTCGGAVASHELATLELDYQATKTDALLFTGGSALGLSASVGVQRWLKGQSRGHKTAHTRIPIVPSVAIYDGGLGDPEAYPLEQHAFEACQHASQQSPNGAVGAATGASVGKLVPNTTPMPGGFGKALLQCDDIQVEAYAVVNSVGDIYEGELIAAGQREGRMIESHRHLMSGQPLKHHRASQNTTLVAVFTNVSLDKPNLRRLCRVASSGMAHAIKPVFTPFDGDVIFAGSVGEVVAELLTVASLATEAVSQAIRNAVRKD